MKKIRSIPYGYTIRDGRTVVEHTEADVIRYIFDEYIKGASLKELAEELTRRRTPYTEKSDVWDKARIARIIDNAKYLGDDEYDPIIDEETYESAVSAKNCTAKEHGGKGMRRHRPAPEPCKVRKMRQPDGTENLFEANHQRKLDMPKPRMRMPAANQRWRPSDENNTLNESHH